MYSRAANKYEFNLTSYDLQGFSSIYEWQDENKNEMCIGGRMTSANTMDNGLLGAINSIYIYKNTMNWH